MAKNSIELIKTKERWQEVLASVETFDFYHTYDYHMLSKKEDETPVLAVYQQDNQTVALPLMTRPIPGTDLFDATSVYGYAGPLMSQPDGDFDKQGFGKLLREYFAESNIISVFSRLNPYIPHQSDILNGLGAVKTIGKVVNIDLTKTLDEQRSQYRRDTRSRVNKARRMCSVRKAETEADVEIFVDIYIETMQKLNADDAYFFDRKYFFDFLSCDGFDTDILLAIDNETGEVAAGSMFVMTNNIIQYHLSGTRTEYMKIAPSRLLLDEMRILGTEKGYHYFNLGGGYQSKEDALFNFKSSFSEDIRNFQIWTFITDEEVYEDLSRKAGVADTDFFPAYRAK